MKSVRKLYEQIVENVLRRILKEEYEGDMYEQEENFNYFEEYQEDYPNENFDVSGMLPSQLAKWCESVGDFYFIYDGFRGLQLMVANTEGSIKDIVNDLYECDYIESTHEVDYLLSNKEWMFKKDFVCVFKIFTPKEKYYIVYQKDKYWQ